MMKRIKIRRLLCLLAAFLLCAQAAGVSRAEKMELWDYVIDVQEDGSAVIIEYRGSATDLKIPESLNDYPITAIGDGAFQRKQTLEKVVIPEGVESIGAKVFSSCDGIKELVLPSSLKSIGTRAFSNCKGLRSVVLPAGLETLGENPFALCDNLTDVSFAGPNDVYEVRDGAIVAKEDLRIVTWLHQMKEDGSYDVPEDIKIIGHSAFVECRELTGITLPEGLESIEESAFNRCVELKEVTLPGTLTGLHNRAFADCESLVTVRIPDNLTRMMGNPFMG